jgi:hypothetical protein
MIRSIQESLVQLFMGGCLLLLAAAVIGEQPLRADPPAPACNATYLDTNCEIVANEVTQTVECVLLPGEFYCTLENVNCVCERVGPPLSISCVCVAP